MKRGERSNVRGALRWLGCRDAADLDRLGPDALPADGKRWLRCGLASLLRQRDKRRRVADADAAVAGADAMGGAGDRAPPRAWLEAVPGFGRLRRAARERIVEAVAEGAPAWCVGVAQVRVLRPTDVAWPSSGTRRRRWLAGFHRLFRLIGRADRWDDADDNDPRHGAHTPRESAWLRAHPGPPAVAYAERRATVLATRLPQRLGADQASARCSASSTVHSHYVQHNLSCVSNVPRFRKRAEVAFFCG